MADIARFRADRAGNPCRLLCRDVDIAGNRAAGRIPARQAEPGGLAAGAAPPWPLAGGARHSEGDQPPIRVGARGPYDEPAGVPEGDCAQDVVSLPETFVTARENWLPPDNFRKFPRRPSLPAPGPNMGLAPLSNLAARDFGYLSTGGLIRRTQDALATMQRLERHRGHFYNWYETHSLSPLLPRYVSSVDSGNLAGHLLTLASGLREQADGEIFTSGVFAGLRDAAEVLGELTGRNAALSQFLAEVERPPQIRLGTSLPAYLVVGGWTTS